MRLLFLLPLYLLASQLSIKTEVPCVCVINQKTGKLIYGKNINTKIFPASITKVAIILYLIEECEIDENKIVNCSREPLLMVTEKDKVDSDFTLAPYVLEDDGVTIDLQVGEKLPLGALLRAMVIRSANDAANILAGLYAGNITEFMFEVNKFCRKIGCKNTHFVNPHGLHHPQHYTTAYDLAIILKRASSQPLLKTLISTIEYEIHKTNKSPSRHIINTNSLIHPDSEYYLPSVVGGKTGYHRRAKYNIAVVAEKNDRSVIVVVNKAESSAERFDACRKIITTVFNEKLQKRVLFNCKDSEFHHSYPWANKQLTATLNSDSILQYYPSEEEEIVVKMYWNVIETPIKKGDLVGSIDIYNQNGVPLQQENLYAKHDVEYKMLYRLRLIINFCIKVFYYHPLVTLSALFFIIFIFHRRRKKVI